MPSKAELVQPIREPEEENDELHDQLDQAADIVTDEAPLAAYKARAEAVRATDRHLKHARDYVEKLGGESSEWDSGDWSQRYELARQLKARLRPALIRELLGTELDAQKAREFIEEWVDEPLRLDSL